MLRAIPLLSALALLLSSTSQAAFVSAVPASLPPATSENASTAFLEGGSESRIGLLCHNDPVNKTDPLGLAPGDSYATRDAAAIAAMTDIAQISVDKDREFGGELYTKKDGAFSYTAARQGEQHRSPMLHKVPNYEGYYHSHGNESGPKYDDENFSGKPTDSPNKSSDKKTADDTQKPGYLVTPSGDMKRYDPDPNKQRNGPVTVVKKIEIKRKE